MEKLSRRLRGSFSPSTVATTPDISGVPRGSKAAMVVLLTMNASDIKVQEHTVNLRIHQCRQQLQNLETRTLLQRLRVHPFKQSSKGREVMYNAAA